MSAQYIKDLDLFKTKQMTPALFAANQVFSESEFEKFLKFIRAFLFRYTVVGGKNTNALEPASSSVASAILDGRATGAREAAALLTEHYVNDDQFKQDFKTINFGNARHHKRVIRYILCTIEGQLSGRPCEFDTDPATVEHILPTNSDGETKDVIDNIGNLTLLEASFNRDLGDQDYSKKPDSYLKSAYKMTHKITEVSPDKWSEDEIGRRASWMADQAAHIWRSDFT